MNIIETVAPIPIEDLKKYFEDNNTKYLIDYENSKLKGTKLLIYLSNLDIPCDIKIDTESENYYSLLTDYLNCPFLLDIETLELSAIELILCKKKILQDDTLEKFVQENFEIITKWEKILDSCTLFNMYCVQEDSFKDFVKSHRVAEEESLEGINYVNLFKYPHLYEYLSNIRMENLYYYEKHFNDYMFKGKNLYSYWAVPENPLFLLTFSIASEELDIKEYFNAKKEDIDFLTTP